MEDATERLRAALRHIADSYEVERESVYVRDADGGVVELSEFVAAVLRETT